MTVTVMFTKREVEAAFAMLDASLHDPDDNREFFASKRDERAALRATEKLRAARSVMFMAAGAR